MNALAADCGQESDARMEATLTHGDDESCHEADRLIAELSSELCVLGDGDPDSLIRASIAVISESGASTA